MVYRYFVDPKQLREYKYVGSDNSITYTYFLSPLAGFLVNFVPMTISANLITLSGHLMVLTIYLLTIYHCGMSYECRLPDSTLLLSTILYMGWLILDNIDGKQARRTNSSSPLGLMFDHQVDALNVTITTSYFANTLMAPSSALTIWFIGSLPFYFTTWEETYTGALNFPFFSAASDGCLAMGILSFIFYLVSPEYIIYTKVSGFILRDLLLNGILGGVILISIYNVYSVVTKSKKWRQGLLNSLWFFYYLACCVVLHRFSPSNITHVGIKELMLCLGFCFAREIGFLQIAHVLERNYTPLNWPNFLILSLLMLNTAAHYLGFAIVNEYYFLVSMTIAAFLYYAHLIYYSTSEITEQLDIPVFSLPKKRRN